VKEKRLLYAISAIDDTLITGAAKPIVRLRRRRILRWAAMAACICLIALGAVCFRLEHPYPLRRVATPVSTGSEIAQLPRWEEQLICDQYSEIPLNGISYSARRGIVPAAQLGEALGTVIAHGWDARADLAGQNADRYRSAALYRITGIADHCAVAVQYEGSDIYYAAVNIAYRPETLGQFIADLNLRENLVLNRVSYSGKTALTGISTTFGFENVDPEKIWTMLLAAPESVNVYDERSPRQPKKLVGISVSVPLLGYENISISVLEGGYLKTNILSTGKLFCIGEANTQAFLDYLFSSCGQYEIIWAAEHTDPMPE